MELDTLGIGRVKYVKLDHSSISTNFIENKRQHIPKHLISKSLISFEFYSIRFVLFVNCCQSVIFKFLVKREMKK